MVSRQSSLRSPHTPLPTPPRGEVCLKRVRQRLLVLSWHRKSITVHCDTNQILHEQGGQGLQHSGDTLLAEWGLRSHCFRHVAHAFSNTNNHKHARLQHTAPRTSLVALCFSKIGVLSPAVLGHLLPAQPRAGADLQPCECAQHVFSRSHPTLFVEINMEIRQSKTAKPAKLK